MYFGDLRVTRLEYVGNRGNLVVVQEGTHMGSIRQCCQQSSTMPSALAYEHANLAKMLNYAGHETVRQWVDLLACQALSKGNMPNIAALAR